MYVNMQSEFFNSILILLSCDFLRKKVSLFRSFLRIFRSIYGWNVLMKNSLGIAFQCQLHFDGKWMESDLHFFTFDLLGASEVEFQIVLMINFYVLRILIAINVFPDSRTIKYGDNFIAILKPQTC